MTCFRCLLKRYCADCTGINRLVQPTWNALVWLAKQAGAESVSAVSRCAVSWALRACSTLIGGSDLSFQYLSSAS